MPWFDDDSEGEDEDEDEVMGRKTRAREMERMNNKNKGLASSSRTWRVILTLGPAMALDAAPSSVLSMFEGCQASGID